MTLTQDLLKAKWKKCTVCEKERILPYKIKVDGKLIPVNCFHCHGTGTEPMWFKNDCLAIVLDTEDCFEWGKKRFKVLKTDGDKILVTKVR